MITAHDIREQNENIGAYARHNWERREFILLEAIYVRLGEIAILLGALER